MELEGLEVRNVGEGFFVVLPTDGGNIGICIKDGSALVIDSGYLPRKSEIVIKMIAEDLDSNVELLFNTHYHADHTFGNQSFTCPILSSAACIDAMQRCLTTHWTDDEISKAKDDDPKLWQEWSDLSITFPTITFQNEEELDFHGTRVLFTRVGGHTPDSSIAYFPERRILFAGDLVFSGLYPTILSDAEPLELISVLKKLSGMEIQSIIPGHGPPCDKSVVRSLIDYWECLISICREQLASGATDEAIEDYAVGHCRLEEIPFNDFKHRRNIHNVSDSLRRRAG